MSHHLFTLFTRSAAKLLLIVLPLAAISQTAVAIPLWWDGGSGTWEDLTAWSKSSSSNTPNPASGDLSGADFTFNVAGHNATDNITLSASGLPTTTNRSTNTLTFQNAGSTTILPGPEAPQLTINGSAGILVDTNSGAVSIQSRVRLGGIQEWRVRERSPGVPGSLNVSGTVDLNGHNLTVTGQGDTTIGGDFIAVSGAAASGALIKTEGGRLTLSGNNLYTGGTQIGGGELVVGSDANLGAASGTLAFVNGGNGTLRFTSDFTTSRSLLMNQSGTIHTNGHNAGFFGSISGGGQLTKTGNGTLTLFGSSGSYTGTIVVDQGTLQTNSDGIHGPVTNNGVVSFVQPVDGTYSGNMSGTGQLLKFNGGALTLSGSNNYGGGTTVNGGGLAVNGSITGQVTVNSGGTLKGSGTIGGPVTIASGGALRGTPTIQNSVSNSGLVAPGNSPGIITINGNYTQSAGASLEIEVGGLIPGTQHDKLVVSGTATLNGALTVPFINGFVPSSSDSLTFLTAASVSGHFSSVSYSNFTSPDPDLKPIVIYDPTSISIYFRDLIVARDYIDRGDMNNDGHVNMADVPLFAELLANTDAYQADFPALGKEYGLIAANANSQGSVDFDDINAFASLVSSGSGASMSAVVAAIDSQFAVPEPSAILLALIAITMIRARRCAFRSSL